MKDNFGKASEGFSGDLCLPLKDAVQFSPRGFVEIIRHRDGKYFDTPIVEFTPISQNLVVSLARRIMSRMISGAVPDSTPADPTIVLYNTLHPSYPYATITDVSEIFLTNMRWGTGGHNPLIPTQAIDPLATDEMLYSPISSPAQKPVVVDYTDVATVRFTGELTSSEGNGNGISEVGLFTDSHDLLFARKTFGVLTKTSDFTFIFRWSIIF